MAIDFNYTPVPKFFLKNGFLEPKKDGSHFKTLFLLHYLFSRCQSVPHSRYHNQRLINFAPWEFLCGREEVSEKTGLTENEVRNQLIRWENQGFLKKSTNSVTNKYTCYTWVSDLFCEKGNQQTNQQVTNRQPTDNHKEEEAEKVEPIEFIEKGASFAFVPQPAKIAPLPAPCLPPLSNESEEKEIELAFFQQRCEGIGWVFAEESLKLWQRTYDIHYLIQTLELVSSRKAKPKCFTKTFAAALRDDYVGEKVRKVENKQWIEGLKKKYGWPWIKITKAYITVSTGSASENYYYERVTFREDVTRKLELYGEKTA